VETKRPPLVGHTEVLIRVAAVGITGSEIHAFRGTLPFRKPPSILGHEVTGEVVETGTGLQSVHRGESVP
jgi:L-iditol 2-dehydrogenase